MLDMYSILCKPFIEINYYRFKKKIQSQFPLHLFFVPNIYIFFTSYTVDKQLLILHEP